GGIRSHRELRVRSTKRQPDFSFGSAKGDAGKLSARGGAERKRIVLRGAHHRATVGARAPAAGRELGIEIRFGEYNRADQREAEKRQKYDRRSLLPHDCLNISLTRATQHFALEDRKSVV